MSFLRKIVSKTGGGIVEAVSNGLDSLFTSDEERMELNNEMQKAEMSYNVEMRTLDIEETKTYLADVDSARTNQSRVQESEHASWLAKNVHPLLAVSIIALTFLMFFWILSGTIKLEDNGMKDIVIYILGALTTIATQVVAYFFGSSQGSKDKQKALDKAVSER